MPDGNLALLDDPVAQDLLRSSIPAHLGYSWRDGTPRVVPIWFHWDGTEVVLATMPAAPKNRALETGDKVAITIDADEWPYKVLEIRGSATLSTVDGVVPEYALAAKRYLGEEAGEGWTEQAKTLFPQMVRIAVTPEWVAVLDFETRFPSAMAAAMSG